MALILWISAVSFLLFILGIGGCYLWISRVSAPYIYDDPALLPSGKKALLLGTAKFTRHGQPNSFFDRRISKAVEIYRLGKTESFIVSGADRDPVPMDEVFFMTENLLSENIPSEQIIKDHKGIRTWNSLWRCKNIYQTPDPIIISQHFHNQRAVFIGLRLGMNPIAINAAKVGGSAGRRMFFRESLARVKCMIDCYCLKPRPG